MWQVIGQSRAVDLLRRSLESERLSHAYLFTGQPHVGKMALAVNLAQALNCEGRERPCGQCRACLRIGAGNHADVQVMGRLPGADSGDAGMKREIVISQIREVERVAALQPYEGRHRVFIIDGAEYLNDEASNCLLKTLEEPPAKVLFVLLAVNEGRLLPTIVSRCQRIKLSPVPGPVIEQALIQVHGATPEKAKVLSRLCRGGIGWAISAAKDEKLMEERSEKLTELTELADESLGQKFGFAASLAARFSKNRESVEETLQLWLEWWRDILLIKEGCTPLITNIAQEETLNNYAGRYSLTQIRGFIESIHAAAEQLAQNANPRLVLEVLMLNIPVKGADKDRLPQTTGLTR